MRIFTTDENYKVQLLIEEINESEELKAQKFKNKSNYISPCAIKLGMQIEQMGIIFYSQNEDYCPV